MKREVEVVQTIEITVDESKFTPEFMANFRQSFYEFDTVEDHIKHLAQLYARGLITPFTRFIEGYGPPEAIGLSFGAVDVQTDIMGRVDA